MYNNSFFIGCLSILLIIVALGAIEGLVLMLLWNWLAPLFWSNAPILSFWQAWGILVLLNLIFSPFKSSSNK